MICRQSSDPIEPPAPVTMTTRSRMQASNNPSFGGTASLPSKSATSTSRKSARLALPSHELLDVGDRLHVHAERLELGQNFTPTATGQRGHGKQNSINAMRLHQRRQIVGQVDF